MDLTSTKGNVTLQLCKLNGESIKGIFDINKEKFNKLHQALTLRLLMKKIMYKTEISIIAYLAFKKTIKNKLKRFNLKKTKLIWLFPKIKITTIFNEFYIFLLPFIKRNFFLLIIMFSLITVFLEVLSIALIIPFISLILAPEKMIMKFEAFLND